MCISYVFKINYFNKFNFFSLVANHRIIFRHGRHPQPMTWSSLEEELPDNRNIGTIHELDVMINNLKKAMRNSNTSM